MQVLLFALLSLSGCAGTAPVSASSQNAAGDSLAVQARRLFIEGSFSAAEGDDGRAVEKYREVLCFEPRNAAVHFALSRAFLSLSMIDSARHYSEKAVFYNPDNRFYRKLLAGISFEMRDFPEAAVQFEHIAASDPSDKQTLFYLAHAYLSAGRHEKALRTFSRVLSVDPENESALAQSLWLEFKLKQYGHAISSLQRLMEQSGETDRLMLTLGELYQRTGQPEKALKTFAKIVENRPSFFPAWIALFEVLVERGDDERFLREAKAFFAGKDIPFAGKIEMTKLFILRSEDEESYAGPAGVIASELVAAFPDVAEVYVIRGMSRLFRDEYELSSKDFRKALAIDPHNLLAREELASSYMARKEYPLIVQSVGEARKHGATLSPRLVVLEGYALFRSGLYRKAARALDGISAFDREEHTDRFFIQARLTQAMAYDRLGEEMQSIKAYEAVLDEDPENALAQNNLAYILAERGEELQRGLDLARKAVGAEPDNPVFLDTLGWLYFKTGSYAEARDILEKALAGKPEEPEIHDHLAEVYRVLGDEAKAAEFRESARKLRREMESGE